VRTFLELKQIIHFGLLNFNDTNLDALFLVNVEVVWDEFVAPWKVKFRNGVLSLGLTTS